MILQIIKYGDKILHKKCKKIKQNIFFEGLFENMFNTLLENMFNTLLKYGGVGLAAPQIGISLRLFIINSFDSRKNIFLNTKILKQFGVYKEYCEGCLSLPKSFYRIKRKEIILIEYFDEKWRRHNIHIKGFLARVILHESDHINGKLIIL
ncbi:peptide deformylase [Candidatus Karelsulcia muelleri]|uniref:peptide deformylase n=1 Tax=Candidatus Karelsulcia muelleri TaxID=336810 RepID=UPI00194F8413|nr:peptide deformylase [Candidatus Karelsulcia muelleri]